MRFIRIIFVVACLSVVTTAQASTTYQMSRLGRLESDGCSSAGQINNVGQVIGSSMPYGANDTRGVFFWSKSSAMVDLQIEGQFDVPGGINDHGQVVGTALPSSGPSHAVLHQPNGNLVPLQGLPGAYSTYATGINNNGWIVGISGDFAVMWQGGTTAQLIGGTTGSQSYAVDINNNGRVAWVESLYNVNHQWAGTRSYVWNQGVNTLLQSLNGVDDCQVVALNDTGILVGTSGNHAVVWNSLGSIIQDLGIGTAYGINLSGQIVGVANDNAVLWNPDGSVAADLGEQAVAYNINNSGMIVGSAVYDEYGDYEAVLWQPVPEPSSLLALFTGLAGIGAIAWRRRR